MVGEEEDADTPINTEDSPGSTPMPKRTTAPPAAPQPAHATLPAGGQSTPTRPQPDALSAARAKAWKRDPALFRTSRQHILRIRAETDQILLAHASEDEIHNLIHSVSAAIDISHAIDERSAPRQCTVPRRRRRPRPTSNLNDPALLAEQERILRDMYPDFAGPVAQPAPEGEPQIPSTAGETTAESPATPVREEDEVDLAMIREDTAASLSRTASAQTAPQEEPSATSDRSSLSAANLAFSHDMMYATSPANFCPITDKWQPPHQRTQAQILRYIRRCMPILLGFQCHLKQSDFMAIIRPSCNCASFESLY